MSESEPEGDGALGEPSEIERSENVKHIELIQAVVARLASNSFLIKGWALTVVVATYGFSVSRTDWRLAVIGSVTSVGFWALDSYYLRQERLFRHLYSHVRRNISADLIDRFSMNLEPYAGFATVKRVRVFFSVTLVVYYALLVVVGIALMTLLSVATKTTT